MFQFVKHNQMDMSDFEGKLWKAIDGKA